MAFIPPPIEILLAITNAILFIIALFLFIRLRKLEKKTRPKKEQQKELAGIADISTQESRSERFDIGGQGIIPPEKTSAEISGVEPKIRIPAELKFEREIPTEKPRKKGGKKKEPVKRELKKVVADVVKEETTSRKKVGIKKKAVAEEPAGKPEMLKELIKEGEKTELERLDIKAQDVLLPEKTSAELSGVEPKIEIPAELKLEHKLPGEKPRKKGGKKKPVEKELGEVVEGFLKEETKAAPKKKVGKRKKAAAQEESAAKPGIVEEILEEEKT